MSESLWIASWLVTLLAGALALRGPSDTPGSLLDGWVRALLALGGLCAVSVEALGAARALGPTGLRGVWCAAAAGAVALAVRRGRPRLVLAPRDATTTALWAAVAALSLATLTVALAAPPTTYDALTYHLPRALHWLQNRSLEPWPTFNYKQVAYPPGSTWLVVTALGLTGSERVVHLPQWLAYTGCIAAAARVADRCGAGPRGSALAALAVASTPMALAQASTAQNDLLLAAWVLSFAWCASRPDHATWRAAPWFALAGGLALATKPTALFTLAALGALAAARAWRARTSLGLRAVMLPKLAAALVALAMFAPHAARSTRVFGAALHDEGDTRALAHGPVAVASTALRYLWLNVPSESAWRAMLAAHRVALGDPFHPDTTRASCVNVPPATMAWSVSLPSEDFAGAPAQLAWTLLALAYVARRRRPRDLGPALLLAATALAFAGFCAALKWQQWGNRLTLPLALLATTAAAAVSARWPRAMQLAFASTALLLAAPHALWQVKRPIAPVPAALVTPPEPGALPLARVPSVLTTGRDALLLGHAYPAWGAALAGVWARLDRHPAAWRIALVGDVDGLGEYFAWRRLRARGRPFRLAHANPIASTRGLRPEVAPEHVDAVIVLRDPLRVLAGPGLARPRRP